MRFFGVLFIFLQVIYTFVSCFRVYTAGSLLRVASGKKCYNSKCSITNELLSCNFNTNNLNRYEEVYFDFLSPSLYQATDNFVLSTGFYALSDIIVMNFGAALSQQFILIVVDRLFLELNIIKPKTSV